ncbi:DUF3846 domain-containing protein [Bifidobacterium sp. SO1]|uniref:DUF3846 domain-containing protein n=1 Tax=Bifidobacterium sp. SO1 TaxID=2809029 RepID=UPI001BDD033B|nr:DUF3846 domain-containing protein [Bifidobacterium sp. SO1]MBT1161758.1 DUF3846 domain-containing protein [Bifidobacterium sp. SO1]
MTKATTIGSTEDRIRVIVVRPGRHPEIRHIENTLASLQHEVGGYIEMIRIAPGIDIICNEEGKINGSIPNRGLIVDGEIAEVVYGTFLIVSKDTDKGVYRSFGAGEANRWLKEYWQPEMFAMLHGRLIAIPITETPA